MSVQVWDNFQEHSMRYWVTTINNIMLHGFEEWEDAVEYANDASGEINVKVYDRETGVTIEW